MKERDNSMPNQLCSPYSIRVFHYWKIFGELFYFEHVQMTNGPVDVDFANAWLPKSPCAHGPELLHNGAGGQLRGNSGWNRRKWILVNWRQLERLLNPLVFTEFIINHFCNWNQFDTANYIWHGGYLPWWQEIKSKHYDFVMCWWLRKAATSIQWQI